MSDIPLEHAVLFWSSMRLTPPFKVQRIGEDIESQYCFSWGACSYDFREADHRRKLLLLFVKFHELVTLHGRSAKLLHEALLVIPEYREELIGNLRPEI